MTVVVFLSPYRQILRVWATSKYTTTVSFRVLSNSSVTDHPTIQRSYILSYLAASLNKQHVKSVFILVIQGGSNMTGTNCDLFTHKSSRSYLNHLVVTSNAVETLPSKNSN
jgi:hypothetical protein